MSGVTSGSVIASFILEALSGTLGDARMQAWGWRVPFWLGGTLAAVTWVARLRLHETPEFDATPRSALTPLRQVLREHPAALAQGLCIALLGASLVMLPLYAPVYLQASFGIAPADTYSATTVSLVWATIVTLLAGRAADVLGPRQMLTGVAALWALVVPFVFALLQRGAVHNVYAFCIAWQTATGAVVGSYLALLSSSFPATVRQTGVALCYNTAFMLAALLPSLFAALVQRTNDPWAIRWVYVGVALVASFAAFSSRKGSAHAFRCTDLPAL
jgi:MFS transporter, MHS family, proline/betaine transporter